MCNRECFDFNPRLEGDRLPFLNNLYVEWVEVWILFMTLQNKERREVLCVNWWVAEAFDEELNTADMVEVSVRHEHAADFVFVRFEVLCVGQNKVDAWGVVQRRRSEERRVGKEGRS